MASDEPTAAAWLYESNYDGRKQVWPGPFPNEMSDRHPEASPLYTASDLASARAQGRREGIEEAAEIAKRHAEGRLAQYTALSGSRGNRGEARDYQSMAIAASQVEADIRAAALRKMAEPGEQGNGCCAAPAVEKLVEAARELLGTLRPEESPPFRDPVYGDEVEALGRRIGYGALMSSASASWYDKDPIGAFVAGPCFGVLVKDAARLRQALSAFPEQKDKP